MVRFEVPLLTAENVNHHKMEYFQCHLKRTSRSFIRLNKLLESITDSYPEINYLSIYSRPWSPSIPFLWKLQCQRPTIKRHIWTYNLRRNERGVGGMYLWRCKLKRRMYQIFRVWIKHNFNLFGHRFSKLPSNYVVKKNIRRGLDWIKNGFASLKIPFLSRLPVRMNKKNKIIYWHIQLLAARIYHE